MNEHLLHHLLPDIEQLRQRGLSAEAIIAQIERLGNPQRKVALKAPATVGDGILRFDPREKAELTERYREHIRQKTPRICKFVPASGAATRMFAFLERLGEEENEAQADLFFKELSRFPFFPQLQESGLTEGGVIDRQGIRKFLLDDCQMARRPKALLPFHLHLGQVRCPLHEHVQELISLACGMPLSQCQLHLTVSPKPLQEFRDTMSRICRELDIQIPYSFSTQMPQTDTVALDEQGKLLRHENGNIVFRPGGHGALIHNLSGIDAELIFIKNIDNVPHPQYKHNGQHDRQVMAGVLLELLSLRNQLILGIDSGAYPSATGHDLLETATRKWPGLLPGDAGEMLTQDPQELRRRLDRPIRICGMVKNEGEPGGGPFWVMDQNGERSLQIVEQAQIDKEDAHQAAIFAASTHFNPVDMVCCTHNPRGEAYSLSEYLDPHGDFISSKNHNGRKIRVLEHPGLWNGAMAGWLTLFVEMDPRSFCPVKTVTDLLRPCHQPT